MTNKEKVAKFIRIFTIPPALVLLLLLLLYFNSENIFNNHNELLLSILFLMIIPSIAYLISDAIPKIKKMGRKGQRKLAFILSIIGYTAGLIYGIFADINESLMLIYTTYFLSVIILVLYNTIYKVTASGHACSITGPLILIVYFIGWIFIIPCLVVFTIVAWSSLVLNRHTTIELIIGGSSAIIAFFLSLLILRII